MSAVLRVVEERREMTEHFARMRQCDYGVQREPGRRVSEWCRGELIVPRFNDFNSPYALPLRCYQGKVNHNEYNVSNHP